MGQISSFDPIYPRCIQLHHWIWSWNDNQGRMRQPLIYQKFFPIFFLEYYKMEPIPVNLLFGVTLFFTAIFSMLAQKVSLKLGRPGTILLASFIATFGLLGIAIYPEVWIMVALFILRVTVIYSLIVCRDL
jgi:hypothetical protein